MKDIISIIKNKANTINFSAIKIGLASPEKILLRSYGEIKKPETINYRTFKAERDGLFCAKIFGPLKDYECICGKYRRLKHKGIICEKCNVEVTLTRVRRSRMGCVILATPIAHIWFLKALPSRISTLLDMTLKDLEKILYFEKYIITDTGLSLYTKGDIISEKKYIEIQQEWGDEIIVKMGAEAVLEMIKALDLPSELIRVQEELEDAINDIRRKRLLKRLKLLHLFMKSENKPEWMILTVLPVLPPDLRPLVPLDGGRFASSDLNDLYRRVINRNNRLKKLFELKAPDIIIKNEKRMLQESVDALMDNGRRDKSVHGSNKRPLKSLADMIKGKQGRFRLNLLGKRVDYSARSVIVVGPKLKLNQCGLPKKIALELFKPFIFGELKRRNITATIKKSKKLVEEAGPEIWNILTEIAYNHPVLLNRAPTLHRLGIQAFEPKLIDGKAIQLHPLVCSAFNADFDGDQMAVHLPLTLEAQLEARVLMMSTNNILSPANGEPIIVPSQDIILGLHYLSKRDVNTKMYLFKNETDVEKAYENNIINLQTLIKLIKNKKIIQTTFGKILLYKIIPQELDCDVATTIMAKKDVSKIISTCYRKLGLKQTITLVEQLMYTGFKYATKSGLSIGINDILIPKIKYKLIDTAKINILMIENKYSSGSITKDDRYNQIIDLWSKVSDSIAKDVMKELATWMVSNDSGRLVNKDTLNPIYMMAESGARGSITQIQQLAGMRGLMVKPDGSIIETPILANFREGLNILQYFISTHGARKGLTDTALKTANSGYLTRRLVDVAQDVVVTIEDCNTKDGLVMKTLIDGGNITEPLKSRILGRVLQENIIKNNITIKRGTFLDEKIVELIEPLDLDYIKVRSVIKCQSTQGSCAKCYGRNLATGKLIDIGEAIGIIAAQSIGEPGTQLTMRTFHIGGAATRSNLVNCIQNQTQGTLEFKNMQLIEHKKSNKFIVISRTSKLSILDKKNKEREHYKIPYGAVVNVPETSDIKAGSILAHWDPHNYYIISETDGIVKYINLVEGETVKRSIDNISGLVSLIVIDSDIITEDNTNTRPCIKVINEYDTVKESVMNYFLSPGTILKVTDEQQIYQGDILAKIPQEHTKIKDITGGLPKVADIFEARKPKDPAILAQISGTIIFGKETKGKKRLIIKDENNRTYENLIPKWKNINVFENEMILKGETIVEGQSNLHDILHLLGVDTLTEHIKKEVQDVYRLQGVRIDEKHIEVIIKQMLRKAVITDSGDSDLLKHDIENIILLKQYNEKLKKENKKVIKYTQILLGITKAALTTDSFIAAASFQETTRVLINAAITGKTDPLAGIKENVIVGKRIPAGTGFYDQTE